LERPERGPTALSTAAASLPLLRGLPLFDPRELERATGFVWIVRSFVTLPLTMLGLLATIAAVTMGNGVAAAIAGTITVLIIVSLSRDTELSRAMELLRRGELTAAESSLRRLAAAPDRALLQRQRARSCLAATAWVRGDLHGALHWTRAWLQAAGAGHRTPADELYLTSASEVQLLALLGDHEEARTRRREAASGLARLDAPPPGDRWALADATCRLLLAFCTGDAVPVRGSIDAWQELCERADDHGLTTALLAWANDALGLTDRAVALVQRARTLASSTALHRQAPALSQWLDAHDDRALHYR
jgi:hypothetical protein